MNNSLKFNAGDVVQNTNTSGQAAGMVGTIMQFNTTSPKRSLQVWDMVTTTGYTTYSGSDKDKVPIGSTGIISRIRERYVGTPNEYRQYKVHFTNYVDGDDLTNLYEDYNLKL